MTGREQDCGWLGNVVTGCRCRHFYMLTSWNGDIFRVTCRWIPLHKGQLGEALMYSLIYAWTNRWASNPDAGDLRRHGAHYDVTIRVNGLSCLFFFVIEEIRWTARSIKCTIRLWYAVPNMDIYAVELAIFLLTSLLLITFYSIIWSLWSISLLKIQNHILLNVPSQAISVDIRISRLHPEWL